MQKFFTKLILLTLLFYAFSSTSSNACDTIRIDRAAWNILKVSSEELIGEGELNGAAIYALDDDVTTYWSTAWNDSIFDYPHFIILDLQDTVDLSGFSITTRAGTKNGRVTDFELFISNDTLSWGNVEINNELIYPKPTVKQQQTAFWGFNAIRGRYVKLIANNSLNKDPYLMIAEFNLYKDTTCVATGQHNQSINFPAISKQYTHTKFIKLSANASSQLPVDYRVKSGPGYLSGDSLFFTGANGIIEVTAFQTGNANYYPTELTRSFEVVNLESIIPTVSCKFTGEFPIGMTQLYPYLLQVSPAIDESDSLSIESVSFTIADTVIHAFPVNGSFAAWWSPQHYGTYSINTLVTATNGQTCENIVNLEVVNKLQSQTITTLDSAVIIYGSKNSQWYYGNYTLPQFVDNYSQIIGYFDTSCPDIPNACDDWDRLAWLEVKSPDGEWIELLRYITPFGVGCSHSIDLTDYRSLLQGNVEFRMYIQTWGSGGWNIDFSLEYITGKPDFRYSAIETLWHGTYNFGDPLDLQPLDTVTVIPSNAAQKSTLRLVTSGHGWGDNNTSNAAEFYKATHSIKINNQLAFTHVPWQICNPNPDGCLKQQGTWTYNRAGWCPGSIAQIHQYDLSPFVHDGPLKLSYIFQESYMDLCHPNNPNCVSGVTCNDCNDTYNPMYRIAGYILQESNQPIGPIVCQDSITDKKENLSLSCYPNPVSNFIFFDASGTFSKATLILVDNSGKTYLTYYYNNMDDMLQHPVDVSNIPDGVYYLKLYTKKESVTQKILVKH